VWDNVQAKIKGDEKVHEKYEVQGAWDGLKRKIPFLGY